MPILPNLFHIGGKLSNKFFETKQHTAILLYLRRTLVRLDYELSFTKADVLVVAKLRLPCWGTPTEALWEHQQQQE